MRRGQAPKRKIEADIKYQSALVAKFINYIMKSGSKVIARGIVYGALDEIEKKLGKKALEVLDQVSRNAGPELELRSRRIGGANYQIPYPVKSERRVTLALRWIIEAARSKKGKSMIEKLSQEMIDAFNNTGVAVKKKMDTHRMADANKAFAHFAW
ncbi:MAG: small subunit ribosomal protein S7 [Parcubacteria group bacterium Gr01-1014_2]|nr:MAG: small subunit ribosomal protein S7 [Parcubacteria group bacterium Gr01-1014_2]